MDLILANSSTGNDSLPGGGAGYQSQSYIETGNFSKSFNTYSTAFAKIDDQYNSDINQAFLTNRNPDLPTIKC